MPRRTSAKNISPSDDITIQPQSALLTKEHTTTEIPKSHGSLLVVLLIIASFFLGSYYTKVQYLEGNWKIKQAVQGTQTKFAVTPTPVKKVFIGLGHFPTKGNKNAKVTIVEFADFRCPFCERFFTETEPQLMKDYVDTGKVQFAFRQFPFLGPASTVAADAAECANDLGKFWEFHDYLYKNQPPESDISMYATDTLTQAAGTLGMNQDQFRSCLDGKKDESKALLDLADGQQAGITGTPTFVVNGTLIVGAEPYTVFKTAIEQALKEK